MVEWSSVLLHLGFGNLMLFLSSREALLLRSVVRARFQFVILTGVAVEEDDLL